LGALLGLSRALRLIRRKSAMLSFAAFVGALGFAGAGGNAGCIDILVAAADVDVPPARCERRERRVAEGDARAGDLSGAG
jgi:hypothetical protein